MAQLSFSGLDELILSMEEAAQVPLSVQDAMLNAAADVVAAAQQQSARDMKVIDTGLTADSIKKGRPRSVKGARVINVSPQGSRTRGKKTVRNAEIAFFNEFGIPRRGIAARPFIATANAASEEQAVQAETEIYDEFLKSKNL